MACAGITALSLLVTPFLMQASRHILREGPEGVAALPTVSRPVSRPFLLFSLFFSFLPSLHHSITCARKACTRIIPLIANIPLPSSFVN